MAINHHHDHNNPDNHNKADRINSKPVQRERYGLIEWNGLSGFVSYGLEPRAYTGKETTPNDTRGNTSETTNEQGQLIQTRCQLGQVCEPMS